MADGYRQGWQEDATNADLAYTRNRIRHQLLPELAGFNPRIAHQLANMATIARDEETYWQKEVRRLLPALLLPGRAVRVAAGPTPLCRRAVACLRGRAVARS